MGNDVVFGLVSWSESSPHLGGGLLWVLRLGSTVRYGTVPCGTMVSRVARWLAPVAGIVCH